LLALAVAALLVASGILLLRALRRFGEDARVQALTTDVTGVRRALKGVLLVLALGCAFVAAAQPQYGRGSRTVPATNLDVVLALDFSKSMYARDVAPSRIERAKIEIGRLITDLPGARFAAVAFAGEPMAFPLTSDGSAVAQFFRQLQPNDMPVGGTAIGRALAAGRELLARDASSRKHRRVLVLVTDGEDLEGDPVSVAESLAREEISVHVVQIGGRTPEPIPDVDAEGNSKGFRVDEAGQPLTTALSAEGEATLARIAEVGRGDIVRSDAGSTGISEVADKLRRMMTEELSERVETVYADVYYYPLGLAVLLLLVEAFIGDVKRRRRSAAGSLTTLVLALTFAGVMSGCDAADRVFVRNSPVVDDAIAALQANSPEQAAELLQSYLSTGKCEAGEIGAPEAVTHKPDAAFDLGLALFALAERLGPKFGAEGANGGASPPGAAGGEPRTQQVACALRILRAVALAASVPAEVRAQARYLAGNLEFLREAYQEALAEYDEALRLAPALATVQPENPLGALGQDIAHNRALALRRLDEQQKQKQKQDEQKQGDEPKSEDQQDESDKQKPDEQQKDEDKPGEQKDEPKPDEPKPDEPKDPDEKQAQKEPDPAPQEAGQQDPNKAPEPSSAAQDERVLDLLEQAPTVQQEQAKRAATAPLRRRMVDK
jgi:Ca-activated chloride channel family protein